MLYPQHLFKQLIINSLQAIKLTCIKQRKKGPKLKIYKNFSLVVFESLNSLSPSFIIKVEILVIFIPNKSSKSSFMPVIKL